ncbi:MAG: hypothetical protein ACJ07L_08060, partial [Opitutales bacterium]
AKVRYGRRWRIGTAVAQSKDASDDCRFGLNELDNVAGIGVGVFHDLHQFGQNRVCGRQSFHVVYEFG